MRKIGKKYWITALTAAFCVTSFCGLTALDDTEAAATESAQLPGIHFTGMTPESNATQNAMVVLNLPQTICLDGAADLIFDVNMPKEEKVYFGVIDEYGNWYEFSGKGNTKSTYRVAESLATLCSAAEKTVNAWTNVSGMAQGQYYALSVSDFYMRAAFSNYGTQQNAGTIGDALADSANLIGVTFRMSQNSSNTADWSIHNMYLGFAEESFRPVLTASLMTPSTSATGANPNGWTKEKGKFFQGYIGKYGSNGERGWITPLQSQHVAYEVIKSEAAVSADGIVVKTNGVTANVQSNASVIVNLPQTISLESAEEIIFDLTINESFYTESNSKKTAGYLVPLAIDSVGNYYEWMGGTGVANSKLKIGKTMENVLNTATVGAWSSFQPGTRGQYGRMYYTVNVKDFYHRVSLNNYGSVTLETAPLFCSPLTAQQSLRSIGFRIPGTLYSAADFAMGDVYIRTANGVTSKILDASEVTFSTDYKYNFGGNKAWLGYLGGYGNHDLANKVTELGWLTACVVELSDGQYVSGVTMTTSGREDMTAAFDAMNITLNVNYKNGAGAVATSNVYQRLDLPAYTGDMTDKIIALRYFDRSGKGYKFQLKLRSAVTGAYADYDVKGATIYYFDKEFGYIGKAVCDWSVNPPAGFDGYILIDTSTITNAAYLALENRNNVNLMFGFHGDWNPSFNADFGKITLHAEKVSETTDLKTYLQTGETYFDFASDTAADGLNGNFTMGSYSAYQNVFSRVYGYKDVQAEVEAMTLETYDAVNGAYEKLSEEGRLFVENRDVLLDYGKIKTFGDGFNMIQGAALRLAEPAGLKFGATVNKQAFDELAAMLEKREIAYKMGTLITRSDLLNGETLVLGETSYRKLDIERTVWGAENTESGTVQMNAAIVNILEQNYSANFTAIAYMTFEYNGETVILYANGGAYSENVRNLARKVLEEDAEKYAQYAEILNKYAGYSAT